LEGNVTRARKVKPRSGGSPRTTLGWPTTLSGCCSRAATNNSALSLYLAYEMARSFRALARQKESAVDGRLRGVRGMTTDQEQDLLRAMLVMAGAGLDSMAKQLVRDALPQLAAKNEEVRRHLEKFVLRKLRTEAGAEGASVPAFLARTLVAPSAHTMIVEEYIEKVTAGSLQSVRALNEVVSALGLGPADLRVALSAYGRIFDIRNKIIHELDIDLAGVRRKRTLRRRNQMFDDTKALIELGRQLVVAVDREISTAT